MSNDNQPVPAVGASLPAPTNELLEALKSEGQKDEWIEMLSDAIRRIVVAVSDNDEWEGSLAEGLDLINAKFQAVNDAAAQWEAALLALKVELEQKIATTISEREYEKALAWRERYLDPERETSDHEFIEDNPLPPQLIAYLIADAEQLREIGKAEWASKVGQLLERK